jgi:hypothetical protein
MPRLWYRASEQNLPGVGDFGNLDREVESALEYISSSKNSTSKSDPLGSLAISQARFKCRFVGATLGWLGVVAWDGHEFYLCHGFKQPAVNTTGGGDIFRRAFLYRPAQHWPIQQILEFSCAEAGLHRERLGARGNIAPHRNIHGDQSQAALKRQGLLEAREISLEDSCHAAWNSSAAWSASNRRTGGSL